MEVAIPIGDINDSRARNAFEDFYRSSRDRVARALALTLGDTALGVDAADEAMLRAYQHWGRIAGYDNPAGWVYRVGLNWARSWLRRRRRETFDVYMGSAIEDMTLDVDVERAMARLDVRFRAVVVLRLYLDWSVDDTAAALGVSPGTVKSRLSRALHRLETDLGGER